MIEMFRRRAQARKCIVTKCWTLLLSLPLAAAPMAAAATSAPSIDQEFEHTVKPFVGKYCTVCHSGPQPTGQFDLKSYSTSTR